MSNILITICARGGSKGCPGKHTRLMAGKPLIEWTIEQTHDFIKLYRGGCVLSTDSAELKLIAKGNNIPWVEQRPTPTDKTPKVPAIRNALIDTERNFNLKFDVIVDLDATAPLRTIDDIVGCLSEFKQGGWDCVLSATVGVGRNPYFNLLEFDDTDCRYRKLVRCKPMDISTRQEAPVVYEANSSIYVYRRDFLLREDVTSPLDGRCGVYVMPDESFYHVDSELDFKIVEFLMKRRHGL